MILLLDIGNTNTHLGLGNSRRVVRCSNIRTSDWIGTNAKRLVKNFVGNAELHGAALCSVVPAVTPQANLAIKRLWSFSCLELTPATVRGLGIDYPKPNTIGPDRLANAVSARHHFGAPCLAVDFGTAVTFDVVNRFGNFIGGIIAPGLAAMTEYSHEKTALLPRIKIREPKSVIGKSTKEAMNVAAVRGYRGMVRTLLQDIKRELKTQRLPVVATGGYAKLMATNVPEITDVEPLLTLEGLRLTWYAHHPSDQ